MSGCVVDRLEGIEIEKQDGKLLAAIRQRSNCLVDMVDEIVTVGQLGQRVIECQAIESVL
ncbi:hypothetical protein SDC9_66227 [bioreactor metagenome]|uniref:Uncharacterized protein n=1 Tax=bioreactor metagenome TaxID=1076179 RepID=A0A644XVN9_9ZZZZ